jgi:hypothetical protein
MKFFSAQSIATTNTPQQRTWSMPIRMSLLPQQLPQQQPTIQPVVSQGPTVGKVKWGEPTWFLFHTLSEKVKEDAFPIIRKELLDKFYSICKFLPCPTCAEHATEYLNGINFNAIRTKDDLKTLFFNFHNEINKKKGYPIFSYSDLDDKYSKANTVAILHYFMSHFEKKSKSIRMIANDFHRSNLVLSLKEWFNKNIHYFDP